MTVHHAEHGTLYINGEAIAHDVSADIDAGIDPRLDLAEPHNLEANFSFDIHQLTPTPPQLSPFLATQPVHVKGYLRPPFLGTWEAAAYSCAVSYSDNQLEYRATLIPGTFRHNKPSGLLPTLLRALWRIRLLRPLLTKWTAPKPAV